MGVAEPRTVKMRKARLYADTYRMTDDERHEFAEQILRRDVKSWSSLTEDELVRILDAMEGFALISHLISQKV